jgi:uncharacterized protein (TIGR02118 family)
MLKIIDLVKRQPGLSVADFQERWSGEAGAALARVPGLLRYVQSHALPQGYARGELLFDGIAEMWFRDEAACAYALTSTAFADAERIADTLFDRARLVRMPVDVLVIKDGAIPENAVKNIEFVNRRPGMALEPFRAHWRDVHGPIASKIPVLRRYEQNHLKLSAYATAPEPAYDGLAITWFQSTADMKAGTRTPEYVATRADEPNFLPDGHLPIILTKEHPIVG